MTDDQELAERFESERTRLRAVAYRMLGSLSVAEDAVQEAWIRLSRADPADIDNLPGWLTVVVSRICLDMIRSRDARREEPVGVRLPDPIVTRGDRPDPEPVLVNGAAGVVVTQGGRVLSLTAFTIVDGRVVAMDILADRDRLEGLAG